MNLFELAYCCRLYGQLTNDDSQWRVVQTKLAGKPDLSTSAHRDAVLTWLRAWGCMHLARTHNRIASDSLSAWAHQWVQRLPASDAQLPDLSGAALDMISDAFANLCERPASRKGPNQQTVRFGPTAASKVLYLLRPHTLPPWDQAIRDYVQREHSVTSYRMFLDHVCTELDALVQRTGVAVSDLPKTAGRPQSGPPKLIDEYYYVVVTRKCPPPTAEELAMWCTLVAGI